MRRVYIPKADGRQRPIGVPVLEDKIVQRSAAEVLSAVYETDFKGFSYGFRPGRSAHQALDALAVGIRRKKGSGVLDADIRGFFDAIAHDWRVQFVEHRIADRRVVRHIEKWLAAGVLEDGRRTQTETGTPQGGSISPRLANVYLHYAFDRWADDWRRHRAHGDVILVLRQTMRKRMQAKRKEVKAGLRRRMHLPVAEVGRWLRSVVRGYYQYHAVPRNYRALSSFRYAITRRWRQVLRRRSQRSRITWQRMAELVRQWLPNPRILHPYPEQRLAVMTQGRSPVR